MKKKIFFIALALTATTSMFAQKQTGDEKNLEVQFAPLGGSPVSISGIRFRMFNSENTAIRIGLNIGGSTTTTVNSQPTERTSGSGSIVSVPELYDTDKSSTIALRVGYEKHFDGTDRLSPYIGADLSFGIGRSSFEREYFGPNTADQLNNNDVANFSTWTMTRKEGSTMFGINAVAGFDFYFTDALYFGAEIGFGFQSNKLKDVEVEVSDESAYIYAEADNDFSDFSDVATFDLVNGNTVVKYNTIIGDGSGDYKTFNWGPVFQPTLRLGWLFN
ncbi:MAG: hypothetical protein R2809_03720 [Flavobacteriales bacterium]